VCRYTDVEEHRCAVVNESYGLQIERRTHAVKSSQNGIHISSKPHLHLVSTSTTSLYPSSTQSLSASIGSRGSSSTSIRGARRRSAVGARSTATGCAVDKICDTRMSAHVRFQGLKPVYCYVLHSEVLVELVLLPSSAAPAAPNAQSVSARSCKLDG